MTVLFLGTAAKEAARTRFRGFNITLPTFNASATGSQRLINPQLGVRAANLQSSTAALGSASTSRVAGLAGRASGPSPGQSSGSTSSPPATAVPMQFPPALFRAASNSKDDVDNQKGMHDMFNGLFEGIFDAIQFGHNQYRLQAKFADVRIDGIFANGGRLDGPPLDGLIRNAPSVAGWGGWEAMVRDAVANGIGQQWSALANSVRVPGLPWYPPFAAFPGPRTPPIPNIPCPFSALTQDRLALSPVNLKSAMRSALRGNMDYCMEFFESVAVALQPALLMWTNSQQVMNVLGQGPVPSFAPPYVPVGPVVGGSIISSPGHIAS